MNFGVPTQRIVRKVEKYPNTAVLTLSAHKGKGTSSSMVLNKKAVETLGLPDNNATVAFSFDVDEAGNCNGVKLLNGSQPGIPDEYKVKVTKNSPRKISEKRTYLYIASKAFDLDITVDNEFKLMAVATDENSLTSFELVLMAQEKTNEVEEVNVVAEEVTSASTEPLEEADFNENETATETQETGSFESTAAAFNDSEIESEENAGDTQAFNPGDAFGG